MTPTTDPVRTAGDGESLRVQMRKAIVAAMPENIPLRGRMARSIMAAVVDPILADLRAAREERDRARALTRDLHRRTQKAERFRDRWKSWHWMLDKRIAEQRRRRKAENDLIALAKMYGEACGELAKVRLDAHQQRLVVDACQQWAGKALGYPWFKDDQKNFPGSIEEHGVCIGEHVEDTIVEELAKAYTHLRAENARLLERIRQAEKGAEAMRERCACEAERVVRVPAKTIGGMRIERLPMAPRTPREIAAAIRALTPETQEAGDGSI